MRLSLLLNCGIWGGMSLWSVLSSHFPQTPPRSRAFSLPFPLGPCNPSPHPTPKPQPNSHLPVLTHSWQNSTTTANRASATPPWRNTSRPKPPPKAPTTAPPTPTTPSRACRTPPWATPTPRPSTGSRAARTTSRRLMWSSLRRPMIAGGMRARAGSMSGRICIILGRFRCVDLCMGWGVCGWDG